MQLRLMQIFLPPGQEEASAELLTDREILGRWRDTDADQVILNLLVPAEETEPIMDGFEQEFGNQKGFHVVLFPVEAVLPRPVRDKPPESEDGDAEGGADGPDIEDGSEEESDNNGKRISREELYAEADDCLGIDRVFLGLTVLSAIVAAIGLIRNDVAVIIGAMVMAPLLGPNMAMALATTLGDTDLLRRALVTNVTGMLTAFIFAVAVGAIFSLDANVPAIAARTKTDFGDVVLALAAGTAGALAFTRGQVGAVIGVMVAVALVPPIVTCGMLLGAGKITLASSAFLLAATNVISVNLAAVITFLAQGVQPRSFWEAEKAKRGVRRAVVMWTILFLGLIFVLWIGRVTIPT